MTSEIRIPADPLLECPTCGLPAEITDRFTLDGVPTPIEHVKLVCVQGHWYTLPVDHPSLADSGGTRRRFAEAGQHRGEN
jgi:hypothetical protein